MNIVEFLKVLVFSLVEGFTEWLPISSTGHLILLQDIIPLGGRPGDFNRKDTPCLLTCGGPRITLGRFSGQISL